MRQRLARFNEWLAIHLTLVFGSMYVCYVFFAYGFLPVLFPAQEVNLLYWSNTVQLWALPALMVGQNLLNRTNERQNARQYEMVQRINHLTDQMHTLLVSQDQIVQTLLTMAEANRQHIEALMAKTNEIDAEVDALSAKEGVIP